MCLPYLKFSGPLHDTLIFLFGLTTDCMHVRFVVTIVLRGYVGVSWKKMSVIEWKFSILGIEKKGRYLCSLFVIANLGSKVLLLLGVCV